MTLSTATVWENGAAIRIETWLPASLVKTTFYLRPEGKALRFFQSVPDGAEILISTIPRGEPRGKLANRVLAAIGYAIDRLSHP